MVIAVGPRTTRLAHRVLGDVEGNTLGPTLDLHGGGSDLIFPHHECSRAQSEAANEVTFVNHWMHAGMVAYQGTKMSEVALGNPRVFVSELVKTADPRGDPTCADAPPLPQ